jgi:hypothetical protein
MLPAENFFIKKVEQGAGSLSDFEREILFAEVSALQDIPGFTPDVVAELNDKAIRALTVAYKQDTSGKNKDIGLVWNEHNESIYKYSETAISGIVQNWYLSEGRPLEKKIFSLFGRPDW